jgi:hypothetical protein
MERDGKKGRVIIPLPLQSKAKPSPSQDAEGRNPLSDEGPLPSSTLRKAKGLSNHDSSLVMLPDKLITAEHAIDKLRVVLPDDVNYFTHLELDFPPEVRFRSIPGGIEFYDAESLRPKPFHLDETLPEILPWVKRWYLSVFQQFGKLMGRFFSESYQGGRQVSIEQPIKDPSARIGKYSLAAFIESIVHGESPD